MRNTDYLSLDGYTLRVFLIVLDELSVSKAAERLGVTQSAVSHTLNKLRVALGDPLFVRSGRGIRATEHALWLREPAREVLDGLKQLTDRRAFDATAGVLSFTIAANDFQRDLIFPDLLHAARDQGVDARLHFIPSGVPETALLRQAHCDMIVTPFPPADADTIQIPLFEDRMGCFYDADVRSAPNTWDEFRSSPYVEVRFADNASSLLALSDIDPKQRPQPHISVPNFGALAAFIRGTDRVTAELSLMALGPLEGLAVAPLPFDSKPLVMYLVWHRRDHADPAHRWLREQIKAVTKSIAEQRPESRVWRTANGQNSV